MSLVQIVDILLVRQRKLFVAVFLSTFAAAALVTFSLPDEYKATSTLFVGENRPISTGANAVQLDEVLAQTYADLLDTPVVEREVEGQLPFEIEGENLEDKVDFEVRAGTRLIEIVAWDGDAERTTQIANTYADTFVEAQQQSAVKSGQGKLDELNRSIREHTIAIQRLEGSGGLSPEDAARLEQLRNELQASRDSYRETQQNIALQGSNVSVASQATVPTAPAKPRPKLYLALGLVLAFVLAVVTSLLRNAFDKRVRDEDELAEILAAPVLTRVPVERATAARRQTYLESFQFLRSNLQLQGADGSLRAIAITSALPGDGKSTIVKQLSDALAVSGADVVAVDCDLRRPRLAAALGVDGRMGVTNVLVGSHEAVELLRPTEIPDLRVLPAGPSAPNPSALVATPTFPRMLARLHRDGEYVLVDTAPVASVADASAVTSAADVVIMVVDLETARRDMLVEAREQILRSSTPLMGIVINRDREAVAQYLDYGYAPESGENGADQSTQPRERRPAKRRQSV
jgi:capsular exopolysaccharide synthesis family protein